MTNPADTPTRSGPDLARQFAELWEQEPRPDAGQFLADAGDVRPAQAGEVLRLDQRQRWQRGERPRLDEYLKVYPALRADVDQLLASVRQEFLLRQQHGESPSVGEYLRLFPEYSDLLRQALSVSEASEEESGDKYVSTNRALSESLPTLPTAGAPPVPDALALPSLPGYHIVREVGRGGMGVVFQAFDRKRQRMIALKTMQGMDPRALLRFKQEFRSLADLNHPNLVTLYELIGDSLRWFFTMELIEGVSFLHHIHDELAQRSQQPTLIDVRPEDMPKRGRPAPLNDEQVARLRDSLAQLATGVHFLHESGKLHRDIKPGNVLVTPQGRVVLLDFGLAAEMDRQQRHCSIHVLGTLAYMAPEQAACKAVSPASDWYAVGVILYEALTGMLPFDGAGHDILQNKQRFDPPAPSAVLPGTPEDLSALCMELLHREPEDRPPGGEVLNRLSQRSETPASPAPRPAAHRLEVPLIGRQEHLQRLAEAFEEMKSGRTVLVDVHGRSGAGKSALVQRFLEELSERGEAVVLTGRCYEQESVPYKALDSLVDALSRYLENLPALEAQALWPRDLAALARVFPVLRRLGAVGSAPRRALMVSDPQEVRRRALSALRELLARLGDRRPLVLAIDDVQWGDEDSAALLGDLLRPPDPPALLLLLCYRREETDSSPCLRALRKTQELGGLDRRDLPVEPLTPTERRELALALLDPHDETAATRAESIARQSGGYPFFVYELVQHLQGGTVSAERPSKSGEIVSLSDVLWSRIRRLPEEARRLLEIVSVASRPLCQSDACQAAEVGEEHTALACLRAGRLLRSSGPGEHGEIETYHDRIRETVLLNLDADTLQHHHRRLVAVLEPSGKGDAEMLAAHLIGADEPARAGHYYALAAVRAAEALAFDRAAKLYRLALELQAPQGEAERQLRTKLANALADAGRGAESARAYLAATTGADPAETLKLQRLAALQFLRSGHIDDGLATLRTVLAAVGLRLLPTPRRAFWALVFQRVRLYLRGLRYRPRSVEQIDPAELTRLDICQSASIGLSMVDTLQGAYFQTRSLLLALRAGEPERLVTALAMEAAHTSVEGSRSRRRTERYFQAAQALALQVNRPYAHAMIALSRGIAAALAGEWRNGQRLCDEAEQMLRDLCTGTLWELGTAHRFSLWPQMFMGEAVEINRRLPRLLKEARERDDLYGETTLSLAVRTFVLLTADEPERARAELVRVMEKWSQQGFHVQHMNRLFDEAQIDLYLGDAEAAWHRLVDSWPDLEQTHLMRVQQIRIVMLHQRARCAVTRAGGKDSDTWLRIAERDARSLRREKLLWADALALLIEAALAFRRGDAEKSRQILANAAASLTAVDMHLYAAAARRRLGQLLGGTQGQELVCQGEEWMNGQKVRNLDRMTALLAPGWGES
ncbi:MAG TPA: protein kinase [Gemmataceae bacterium]